MNFKQYMYGLLVNENAEIKREYDEYRQGKQGAARANAWFYLLKLNIQYRTGVIPIAKRGSQAKKKHVVFAKTSESLSSKRKSPAEFAKELSKYDIISFDVFDTLIFRPFSQPSDLFFFTGSKLKYFDFKQIRIEMEESARRNAEKEKQTREVSFEDIWKIIEEKTGIDCAIGMHAEWEDELRFCFANSYMLQVIRELQIQGKQIILISDMYLKREYIQKLLKNCGYKDLETCFVSCDYGHSKSEGTLYEIVKKDFKATETFAHVGDNMYADVEQAKKYGFQTFYYNSVNSLGMKYRPTDMSIMMRSVYSGLINSYLHNGLLVYSKEYEFGFIYGGFFVLGYCQWIHEYVKRNQIDKILFLSRDGDVLSKAYNILYPQEENTWAYVYWSRYVATKLAAQYFKYDYFRRFLRQKINQNYTVYEIFETMELLDMLDEFFKSCTKRESYTTHSILNHSLAEEIEKYLLMNWNVVLAHYAEELEAGKEYYSKILKGCSKAVAIDVGWAGSGPITLNYVVNHLWNIKCDIKGLIAGTNSVYCKEQDSSESLFYTGELKSYLFSQSHNRDLWEMHNPGKGDNIIVEMLLSANHGSLRRFVNRDIKYEFAEHIESKEIADTQQGILDFIQYYLKRMKYIPEIRGRDAFAPIALLEKNRKYLKEFPFMNQIKINVE